MDKAFDMLLVSLLTKKLPSDDELQIDILSGRYTIRRILKLDSNHIYSVYRIRLNALESNTQTFLGLTAMLNKLEEYKQSNDKVLVSHILFKEVECLVFTNTEINELIGLIRLDKNLELVNEV